MSQILASPSAGHASKKMGLLPLEFADCLLDSPYFRENLRAHEKQLDQTSADIKGIIKDVQVNHTILPMKVAYGIFYHICICGCKVSFLSKILTKRRHLITTWEI